jgi:hypothetical protein
VCQPSGQPPAVVYYMFDQNIFNCYLTIIYMYIYIYLYAHIINNDVHYEKKNKVWKQSRNWLFYSSFKVSKYLSGHHCCLSCSICPRRFFLTTIIFLFSSSIHTHTAYTQIRLYCSLITHVQYDKSHCKLVEK